jgi:molybdopterin-containing oxidoreductase family iron-sulfur binding subunit
MAADPPGKKYWQSLASRDQPSKGRAAEFPEELPVGQNQKLLTIGRRTFFQMMGVGTAALAASACHRAPVGKIIPYLNKPEEVTPGTSLWYASSCGACSASCGILLKARDGRPIKIEGNDLHPLSEGGVCALGQSAVLSLYDSDRARGPLKGGSPSTWSQVDTEITSGLQRVAKSGRGIRLVVPPILGPTAEKAIGQFVAAFPTAQVVHYDPFGDSAIADAHAQTHGLRVVPLLHFDHAAVIASFGADFLGTWLQPVSFTRQWARARDVAKRNGMSRHYQVEPHLTLTGSNADRRFTVAPSDVIPSLAELARRVIARSSHPDRTGMVSALRSVPGASLSSASLDAMAADLLTAGRQALVVYGGTEPVGHAIAAALNEALGATGITTELDEGVYLPLRDLSFDALLGELDHGSVGAVLFHGVNPVHTHPRGADLAALLARCDLTVSTADRLDETSSLVSWLAPDHHFLESWDDTSPRHGLVGLRQPAITPLFDTRGAFESLLRWSGTDTTYYDYLRDRWQSEILSVRGILLSFQEFWEKSVQDGFTFLPEVEANPATIVGQEEIDRIRAGWPASQASSSQPSSAPVAAGSQPASAPLAAASQPVPGTFRLDSFTDLLTGAGVAGPSGGPELLVFQEVGMRDGSSSANNAWVQELPDPITKLTWRNVALIAPSTAARLGLEDGDLITVATDEASITLPALSQPGVHPQAVAIAAGYGRTKAGHTGNGVGVNVLPLTRSTAGHLELVRTGVRVAAAGGHIDLALTQTESSEEGRDLVHETDYGSYLRDPSSGNQRDEPLASMWSAHEYPDHRWAMAIDLNACTGCSACLVSCQAENNVAVVGEDEVRRRREMGWIRIDRYYEGDPDEPQVVHQPLMCQHCENAPCETVCPVLATVHSSEGLNQQIYNRCVGTRYCANNCPYKVRRFNWFDYPRDDQLANMVLNPDVVVRSRGVMEKCSMCVQRIMEGKDAARVAGRKVVDGDIRTACQQSCPAQAITFGDVNDPSSRVAQLAQDDRAYRLLAELNVGPSIVYLTKVRNPGSGQ